MNQNFRIESVEYYVELKSVTSGKWTPADTYECYGSLAEAEQERDCLADNFREAGYGFWTALRITKCVTTVLEGSEVEV